MQRGSPRLASDIQKLFEKKDRSGELAEALYRWINERSASSEILYWLCKERGGPFPHLFNPSLFGAVLSALEMDQLSEAKKSMKLRDLVLDDATLLSDFFTTAELEVVRDAMRRLLLTTVFDDLNKRSLLGRLIKLRPELGSMVSGEAQERGESLTVSWASLERRKKEFDDLVNRQIPQNVRDIQIARSYGDLRENFEFKSAKEQQAVLARRKSELERALGNARGTNFEDPDTSVVSIGTTVTLQDSSGQSETYSILGAWDSAPELGIISYKAALGQSLLGQPKGTVVTLSDGRTATIMDIQAFKNLELLEQIADIAEPAAAPATASTD
jgi:transcription elongation GreA/GreB family factor